MAFDRTIGADLQALYDERTIDPLTMNYPSNDDSFIARINDPEKNVGGQTTVRPFTVDSMLEALQPTDFDAQQTAAGADVYTQILTQIGGDIETYKAKWRGLFSQNSPTVTALDAQTRRVSRAEFLWGEGTSLVSDDWIAARVFVEGA